MVNKKPPKRAFCCGVERSERLDIRRLQAFGAALHFELDFLAFLQRLEAVHLDRGVMREQIFAAFSRGDEAKPLESLNHLTVPVAIYFFLLLTVAANPGATKPGTTIKKGTDGHYGRRFGGGRGVQIRCSISCGPHRSTFFLALLRCHDDRPFRILAHHPSDADPIETREWLDAFDALSKPQAAARDFPAEEAAWIMRARATCAAAASAQHALQETRLRLPTSRSFPATSSSSSASRRSCAGTRSPWWMRANRAYPELGGHIASYASAADLFEVGFNHFFRSDDLVYFQPHSAPGCTRGRFWKAACPKSSFRTTDEKPKARDFARTATRT